MPEQPATLQLGGLADEKGDGTMRNPLDTMLARYGVLAFTSDVEARAYAAWLKARGWSKPAQSIGSDGTRFFHITTPGRQRVCFFGAESADRIRELESAA